ncbi:MAG: serine/threonine protein kinase [Symploca sp. SIO3E6]|nr:serine/threonine protein kinase [Caldora sp. SIO3E6]
MTNNLFPNFSNYGYQVTRELGQNHAGGRVTYLATEINTGNAVVVKQFQFARTTASWSQYSAYDREIQVLRGLEHPSIPRYLDSFQTAAGFCLVQEYKDAPSLATKRQWKPQQIKQIAIAVLEILHYLQSQIPPVIHRDLKPENILVDDRINVYLVDFGFARTGGGEVAVSSVVKGTLGFMPPEQMFNRQLTLASDLYSLGATLICLLTGTTSTEFGSLIDDRGRINFQQQVPQLSQPLISWLQKMVEPNFHDRYAAAEEALDALIPLEVLRPIKIPQVAWAMVGLLVTSLAIAMPIGIKFWQSQLVPELPFNDKIQISTDPKSSDNLDRLSIKSGRVYFTIETAELTAQDYQVTCQIFDRQERLVAMGQSTLKASAEGLKAWCWYDFQKADQPGKWMFKFALDSQIMGQKKVTILP